MGMNNRSRSILLQVAFKAAAEENSGAELGLIEQRAKEFFESLEFLHETYGISDIGSSSETTSTGGGDKVDQTSAPVVSISGADYYDYRGFKSLGIVDANFPDFKLVSNMDKAVWLSKKDGSPTKFALDNNIPELVTSG